MGHGAEVTRKRKEKRGRMIEVYLWKKFLHRNLGNLHIGTPRQPAPLSGQAVARIEAMRLGNVFDGCARSFGEQDSQGVPIECSQTAQNASHFVLNYLNVLHMTLHILSHLYHHNNVNNNGLNMRTALQLEPSYLRAAALLSNS